MKKMFQRARGLVATPSTTLRQPIEVGAVAWLRELDDALARSSSENKPVFALFQEVPGCAGCKQFGRDVLSHSVIVDAIEHEFVPLLIHNNTPGRDEEVLRSYGEPAWNYQVVRFLDSSGVDLIERRDRVWETGPLAARMIHALETAGRDVPAYLRLLEQEHSDRLATAYLAQSCFWVGEMELGKIDGVVTTEAGFMDGHEVTSVRFDPRQVSLAEIAQLGAAAGVADAVYADASLSSASNIRRPLAYRSAPVSDQKRQLRGRIDPSGLTAAQATKMNAFVASPDFARRFLAPGQLR